MLAGQAPLLLLCDHASKALPAALGSLGIPRRELDRHIGWDIGASMWRRSWQAFSMRRWWPRAYSRLVIELQPLAGRRGLDTRGERRHAHSRQPGSDQAAGRRPRRGLLWPITVKSSVSSIALIESGGKCCMLVSTASPQRCSDLRARGMSAFCGSTIPACDALAGGAEARSGIGGWR